MNSSILDKQIAEQLRIKPEPSIPVTRDEFDALNAKLDIYIRTQNALEKDFREVERDVYRMKEDNVPKYQPSPHMQMIEKTSQEHYQRIVGNAPRLGETWLSSTG